MVDNFRHEPVVQQARVIQLNPLSGDTYQRASIDPDKSDLKDYDLLFSN